MAERSMPGGIRVVMGSRLGKILQDVNVWLYRKSGGRMGSRMKGAPVLLLTTRGRKTGKSRTTPLIYLENGPELAVVASKGGWPEHPLWYRNLQAEPKVGVEIGTNARTMSSRTASAEERQRLWPQLVALYSDYASYQSWSDREIPVVLLSPRD